MIGLRRSTTSDLEGSDTIALEHANYDGRGQALMDVGDLAVAAYDEDLRAVERRFDYGNCVFVVLPRMSEAVAVSLLRNLKIR